jgi:twinkle protein
MYFDKLSDLGIKLTRRAGSEKTFCPQCHDGRKNKRDRSLSVNVTTGEYKCHNTGCEFHGNVRAFERKRESKKFEKPPADVMRSQMNREKIEKWFSEQRGISKKTLDRFFIFGKEEWMPQTQKKENCICFPYFRNGEIINIKFRDARKSFRMVKDAELILYNLPSISEKKFCIITEGEIDSMSAYESGFGDPVVDTETGEITNENMSKWGIVSVPNGATDGNQKMDYLDNCAEWLVSIEEFVLATDGDTAGDALKTELIRRLGVERCKTITYPYEECVPLGDGRKRRCKDLNEVLVYLGKQVVVSVINNAQSIPVDGVFYVEDIFPTMLQNFKRGIELAPKTHFGDLDDYFRWKKGDINLFTGYANHGKTTLVLQMMLTKSIVDGWKWAVFSPENFPATDFYDDLIEMYVGKWLDNMGESEYTEAADFLDKHIYYVYPEDSHDVNSINERFRYLVLKKGIDGVLLDPFNQLDHLQKPYQREDQYLSEVLKDVKRFALLNCIVYNIIAHPIKQQRQTSGAYPPVDMYDVAGGAMFANKVDGLLSYYRPRHHEDKASPEVEIHIQKIKRRRTGGKPGMFEMRLKWATKRFVDNLTDQPFCNPRKQFDPANQKQADLWESPLDENNDLPF